MKFIANNTFGKFCQNQENYVHIEVARTSEQLKELCRSDHFLRQDVLSEDLLLVEMVPEKLQFKYRYAVVSTILDLAKLYIYKFWYNTLLPHFYLDIPQLLKIDTDSILFSIKCKNFMKKYKALTLMDFSNFPKSYELFSNKKNEIASF